MALASPNILWIFGDQHRGQALSCMGDPNVNTPNIDRLANDGLNMTTAVSGCPLCCPARGTLLTGKYPHLCVPGHQMQMPPDQPTIAHVLKENGYHTAWFGKWHVDGFQEREGRAAFHIVPKERRGGFDDWVGFENNNSQWDCFVHGHLNNADFPLQRLPNYETDDLSTLLIEHLKRRSQNPDQPFFAALSVQPPHDPYVAPPEYMRRHNPVTIQLRPNVPDIPRVTEQARRELAGYYAMIENFDDNIGRIRATLDELGLADNTHILFFSDHGDSHGSLGQFRKTSPWQESIRVPFIIGGRKTYEFTGGRDKQTPINLVDIPSTTLGLCGITPPSWMQGTDYSHRRIRGKSKLEEPDSAYLQMVIPTGHPDSVDQPWRGIITRDGWKYVCLPNAHWLMYNLNEDPYEQCNLAHNSRFRAERNRLHARLARWIDETKDQFELPKV